MTRTGQWVVFGMMLAGLQAACSGNLQTGLELPSSDAGDHGGPADDGLVVDVWTTDAPANVDGQDAALSDGSMEVVAKDTSTVPRSTDAADGSLMADLEEDEAGDGGIDTGVDAGPPVPCDGVCGDDELCVEDVCVTPWARPIHPLSTSLSTTNRPLFRVQLSVGLSEGLVEICTSLACSDGVAEVALTDGVGLPEEALAPGIYYWRAWALVDGLKVGDPSHVWQIRVGFGTTDVATSWGTMFDLNLDGIADALVGACGLSGCTEKVFVHLGTAEGLSETPTAALSNADAPYFGFHVANAGDVNGDGYPDVLVGTGFGDAAYLYLVGPGGLSPTPAQSWSAPGAWYGFSAASAGDVNGDGYGDIVVGAMLGNVAFVYHGGPEGPGPAPDVALSCPGLGGGGVSVSGAGDFNGDGYGDIVVGAGVASEAYTYHGGPAGMSPDPVNILQNDGAFGTSVEVAGDVNGDGYSDIIVGAPNTQSAYLYLGGPSGINPVNEVPLSGGISFGLAVAAAGDLNGDGRSDIAIGGNYAVRLYMGSAATGVEPNPIHLLGTTPAYGDSLSGIGDCNQDGYDDLLVGATDESMAYVYAGGTEPLATLPFRTLHPEQGTPGYGFTVACLAPVLSR